MSAKPLRIAICSGEASGDQLAAELIRSINAEHPNVEFFGIGGEKMQQAGCKIWFSQDALAVMGLFEVIKALPRIYRLKRQFIRRVLADPPDLFIGVDSTDFNLSIAKSLRPHGIKTVQYKGPSVWAWRQGRIKTIKKAVDLTLTLFPFEQAIYRQYRAQSHCIGHALADQFPLDVPANAESKKALGFAADKPLLLLMPGSRKQELHYLAADFLQAVKICQQQLPNLQCVCVLHNQSRVKQWQEIQQQVGIEVTTLQGSSHQVMQAADAILLASGTASLEAMLLKKPMVVAYRLSWLSFQLLRRLIKVKHIALPNLLADERLVPELIQHQVTPEALAEQVLEHLTNEALRQQLTERFYALHQQLRLNASQQATRAILQII